MPSLLSGTIPREREARLLNRAIGVVILLAILAGIASFFVRAYINTTYASGYSWFAFHSIAPGMTRDEVLNKLGKPVRVIWGYKEKLVYDHLANDQVLLSGMPFKLSPKYLIDDYGLILAYYCTPENGISGKSKVTESKDQLLERLGKPDRIESGPNAYYFVYAGSATESDDEVRHFLRAVVIDAHTCKVRKIISRFTSDWDLYDGEIFMNEGLLPAGYMRNPGEGTNPIASSDVTAS